MNTAPKAPFSPFNPFLPLSEAYPSNPFAAKASESTDVPVDAPEGTYTYALVQSAPAVAAEECEVAAAAVEVVLRWGKSTLHVAHLTPPRSFFVGEATDAGPVDFTLPPEVLGATRFPVVRKAADGSARVVIPAGARGTVSAGEETLKVSELAQSGKAEASTEVAGAIEITLRSGTRARFEIGGVEVEITSVQAGRKVSGRFSMDRRGLPYQALSMAFHLGLLGAAAVFMPPMALASEDSLSREQIEGLRTVLSASAEREVEAPKEVEKGGHASQLGGDTRGDVRATGGPAGGPKGGSPSMSRSKGGVPMSREEAIQTELDMSLVGVLRTGAANPTSSVWGDPTALHHDPLSARTDMWSDAVGETNGGGGIALTGVGDGNGGNGQGVTMGPFNTGRPGGIPGDGLFRRPQRAHKQADLSMRPGDTTTSGPMSPELIQRTVRQNFGRFRACYEGGLRANPSLAGRVSVRFVIGRDGAVMSSSNGGSDLPDASVVSCVVGAFRGLQFSRSEEGGAVTVTYPIMFSPAR